MVKVSVIVPVYNPGSNLDDLIRTLLEQSLPAEEYEAIFVDDGSTDGTGARLDALAAEHDFIRVEHIPNSGWPGRPRNVGTDLARGEYVYYVDNDDYLALRALERLHKRARRDDADVVVGKVLGHGKTVPRDLFAEDRKEVTLDWPPLLGLLTPHKLFRRSFLAEHGIRFPEGRTRLEDNHFCVHAYFHTDRVSILTGRPVYHWVRRGDENASLSVDPVVYRAGLTAVLDIVEAHTEPGPQRDRLLAHWLRAKVVRWMGGGGLVSRPPEVSAGLHRELRSLMLERLGPQLDAHLPLSLRVRAAILRHGTLAELRRFADWETGLEAALEVEAVQRDAALDVSLSARLPLTFARDGAGLRWVPPAAVRDVIPAGTDLRVAGDLDGSPGLFLRHVGYNTEHALAAEHHVELADGTPALVATATLDPATMADGGRRARPGRWKIGALIAIAGFESSVYQLRTADGEPVMLEVSPPG